MLFHQLVMNKRNSNNSLRLFIYLFIYHLFIYYYK